MSATPSFGSLTGSGNPLPAPTADTPFRMVVLGDFSGRGNRGRQGDSSDIAARKLHKIDRGNFEQVMEKLAISINLTVEDDTVTLPFRTLDDFHPDQIISRVDQFDSLDTDYDKSMLLRQLLHNADFQALEATWRGLDWMLRRALKGGKVEVHLFDLTLEEFVADLTASEDLTESGVNQNLIEKGVHGPKGAPWALFVSTYQLQPTARHADVLGRMAKIGQETRAPFLAGLPLAVLVKAYDKDATAAAAWQALRQLPESALLGLVLPRFLARLPYSEGTVTIDSFTFEEFGAGGKKKKYLWGSAALACAALLGQNFQKNGWALKPGGFLDLTDMPLHAFVENDEEQATLAEAWLNRAMVEQMGKQGFMCLLCVKGRDQMQLFRFQSLQAPPAGQPFAELQGPWGEAGAAAPAPRPAPASTQAKIGGPTTKPPPAAPVEELTAAPPAEEEDPELAAMMRELEGGGAEAPAAAPPAEAAPAEDPELDAMMKELMGGEETPES